MEAVVDRGKKKSLAEPNSFYVIILHRA